MINKALRFVDTKAGRFRVGDAVKSTYLKWKIIGFEYKGGYTDGHLWFHLKTQHNPNGGNERYRYSLGMRPQFTKIKKPKKLPKYKEPSGLYFDRKKGFYVVKADE
jgi:hypothetical protein